jgi:hypothetical protein
MVLVPKLLLFSASGWMFPLFCMSREVWDVNAGTLGKLLFVCKVLWMEW